MQAKDQDEGAPEFGLVSHLRRNGLPARASTVSIKHLHPRFPANIYPVTTGRGHAAPQSIASLTEALIAAGKPTITVLLSAKMKSCCQGAIWMIESSVPTTKSDRR